MNSFQMNSFKLIFVSAAMCAAAWAQGAPPAIKTTGNAVVRVTPDQAQIEIGVVTQAKTAQEAASQNAAQMQAAIDKVKAVGGPKVDIRTTRYSLNPVYAAPKVNGGKPTMDGYTAVNTLVLTCTDLS